MLSLSKHENGAPAASLLDRPGLGQTVERDQRIQQRRHVPERHHVGAVARRRIGILMGFHEDGGDADGDRGARQNGHEFALPAP